MGDMQWFGAALLVGVAACGGGTQAGDGDGGTGADASPYPIAPASMQRAGDPAKGYDAMVNAGYISCGVPMSVYRMIGGTGGETLPGRTGDNADLPYYLTATTSPEGVEIVAPNCLECHAGHINGQLVVGLGGADQDFTNDQSQTAALVGQLVTDPTEKAEWRRWADRVDAIGPYTVMATRGVNPADNLTAALIAHRDEQTMAWSAAALLPEPPKTVLPVDVPPWWRMKKKAAMFYNASGRGDHARIMMTASILCTDTIPEERTIDSWFPDIRAWIASIEPPKWPFPVDAALAMQGRQVYVDTCASCHGGGSKSGEDYPNYVIPLATVGTDPALAGASQFGQVYVDWYNGSFFGEAAQLVPQAGYIAPPLDGIWATAPYLHNGSVPTLAALLDSSTRPTYWTRNFDDSTAYDQKAAGWQFTALDHGQAGEPSAAARAKIYDTTLAGYGNGGHTYGDALSTADRQALIEYLKTL